MTSRSKSILYNIGIGLMVAGFLALSIISLIFLIDLSLEVFSG